MEAWGKKRVKRIVYAEKSIIRILGTYGCRKTIKLSEEPNTIKTHASAL
ncbi:hypothetical protein Hanom_Chr00s057824g01783721 [Helianthus anomalus]